MRTNTIFESRLREIVAESVAKALRENTSSTKFLRVIWDTLDNNPEGFFEALDDYFEEDSLDGFASYLMDGGYYNEDGGMYEAVRKVRGKKYDTTDPRDLARLSGLSKKLGRKEQEKSFGKRAAELGNEQGLSADEMNRAKRRGER